MEQLRPNPDLSVCGLCFPPALAAAFVLAGVGVGVGGGKQRPEPWSIGRIPMLPVPNLRHLLGEWACVIALPPTR